MNDERKFPALEPGSNYVNPQVPRRMVRQLAAGELPACGAHLVTPWLGFAHHGIYAGEGKVVHYGALMYDIIRKPVEEVTLQQFSGGRPVFIVEHGEQCDPVETAICRARSRLGEKRYRLLSNNCEHFVEWCLHGVHRSYQAETALAYPRMVGERIERFVFAVLRRLFGATSARLREEKNDRQQYQVDHGREDLAPISVRDLVRPGDTKRRTGEVPAPVKTYRRP